MSRNFVPALFAIGVGIFTGYYTFNPTFAQLQYEKEHARQSSVPSGLSVPKQDTESSAPASFEQDRKSST
ncbi:hypothetical protein N7452_010756 [Penicillium brevicompactum]|uniref:Uncharacterized protein n=1 Tax=Penicillium brevicompactum TaxID=5074 RepID=A0A9W9Q330_PENBR|nr:hypothetical protein N7452_010756 [Penicillium brevicompactum]